MKLSTIDILNARLLGRIIASFEYRKEGDEGYDFYAAPYIGKPITKVSFGFNDDREDSGLLIFVKEVVDPVFVYDNEKIELIEA